MIIPIMILVPGRRLRISVGLRTPLSPGRVSGGTVTAAAAATVTVTVMVCRV
jgi:hypothetical protein